MSNPETRFGKRLRKLFPPGHVIRVENPAHPGTPDLNLCIDGVEFWVELKQVASLPKRSETPVFRDCLRPEQRLWLRQHSQAGGRCYIAAFVEQEALTYIIPGNLSMEFNGMCKAQLDESNIPLERTWKP